MIGIMNNALSAVRAYTRGVLVSSQNIANSATEDYRPLSVTFESVPTGGVVATVDQAPEGVVGVDLAQETVDLIARQRAIEANLKVIHASEKTLGVLLDTIG
jgi:flagellar hook-associated protein FlgK